MSDETTGVEENGTSVQKWMPAIYAGVVLILTFIAFIVFSVIFNIALLDYLRPLWDFWRELDMTYPVQAAIYYLLVGVLTLGLAGLLVSTKGWYEAFFDELQLAISKAKLNYLLTGLIIGAAGSIVFDAVQNLSSAYLFKEYLYIGLIPEKLAVAALYIIPLLVWCVGQVALVQGYFQRTISKNYGAVAGIIVAVFVYMLLFHFPNILVVLQSSRYPELFFVSVVIFAGSLIQTIVIGATIAYLFLHSKSIYMPVGFIFAWQALAYVFKGFVSLLTLGYAYPGDDAYLVLTLLQVLVSFLTLAFAWCLCHNNSGEQNGLKGKLQNIAGFFRYHDED